LDRHRTGLDLSLYARSSIEQEYTAGVATSRFELQRTGSFIALNRPLDPVTTGTLRFKSELTEITALPLDPTDPGSPVLDPSLLSDGRVVSIALTALRDSRDDRFRPTRGQRISLNTEVGLLALGGDFGFTKYVLDYQRVFRAWGRSVFVGRAMIASAAGTLPLQEQFLLGGPSTVRSLSSGKYRGNNLVVVNLEYRFSLGTLIKQLGETQAILFADAGSTQLTTTDLKVGYGIGVAVTTPIGPIRLDFAWGPEGQQTWISLGAPF
jgi:outer membrane protein insertion porin family